MYYRKKINYRELYPDASDEVIAVLRRSDRKMEYQEYDIKAERTRINAAEQKVTVIPSREDSLDRLVEQEVQFRAELEDVDEAAIKCIMLDKLHDCLGMLAKSEMELITALFFDELSERQYSEKVGIPQKTINDRRHRVLAKLKKLLENRK